MLGDIAPSGELQPVSFGAAMDHNIQFYRDIPVTSTPAVPAQAGAQMGASRQVLDFSPTLKVRASRGRRRARTDTLRLRPG